MAALRGLAILLLPGILSAAAIDSRDFSPADLFQNTKVWTVEFTVTEAQWKIMAPKQGTFASTAPHNDAGTEFDWAHAAFTIDGKRFSDIAVRYKGNNTFRTGSQYGKISLKIDLNKYVKGQKLAGLSKLNFASNINDPGWMNEVLAFRFFRDAGVPAPRTSFARIYFTVTGLSERKYWGLYSIVEDVDETFTTSRSGLKDGLLLKPVTRDLFGYMGNDWANYERVYDPKDDPSDAQKQRLIDFCRFVTYAPAHQFAAKLGDYLDLDAFVRYIAATVALADLDSILDRGKNIYVWLNPKTQKFSFIPWDQDHTFGQYPALEQRALSISHPWLGTNKFLEKFFSVPEFKARYVARLAELRKTIFNAERIAAQVNEIGPAIRPAVAEESQAAVRRFDGARSGDLVAGETVKSFIRARVQSVEDQLDGKSSGERTGSPMRVIGAAGR